MRAFHHPNLSFRGRGRPRLITPPKNSQHALPHFADLIVPEWKFRDSVAINLFNVPIEANAQILFEAFRKQGHLVSIDIFEDLRGKRENRAKIRFKFVLFTR